MRSNRPSGMSQDEIRRYLNPVRKWRVSTGALIGASLTTGSDMIWRGFEVNWDFFHDRMQELFTVEVLLAGIIVGGICGALVCLIRNQQKGAIERAD